MQRQARPSVQRSQDTRPASQAAARADRDPNPKKTLFKTEFLSVIYAKYQAIGLMLPHIKKNYYYLLQVFLWKSLRIVFLLIH